MAAYSPGSAPAALNLLAAAKRIWNDVGPEIKASDTMKEGPLLPPEDLKKVCKYLQSTVTKFSASASVVADAEEAQRSLTPIAEEVIKAFTMLVGTLLSINSGAGFSLSRELKEAGENLTEAVNALGMAVCTASLAPSAGKVLEYVTALEKSSTQNRAAIMRRLLKSLAQLRDANREMSEELEGPDSGARAEVFSGDEELLEDDDDLSIPPMDPSERTLLENVRSVSGHFEDLVKEVLSILATNTWNPTVAESETSSMGDAVPHLWRVIAENGLLVRQEADLKSSELGRLPCGAVLLQKDLRGERLGFHLLRGAGPLEGYVSLRIKGKAVGGGLCQVCRTVDRLAALTRGPAVPPGAEQLVLQKLRGWIGDLQDLGEVSRGVAPNPIQGVIVNPPEGVPPVAKEEDPPQRGCTAKAPPAPPPPPPVPGVSGGEPRRAEGGLRVKAEEEGRGSSPVGEVASSSRPSRETGEVKKRHKSESRRARKRERRSRSGRSRTRRRARQLASPVRPEGVGRYSSRSEDPSRRRERKARPLEPRSPSRPPPAREAAPERPAAEPVRLQQEKAELLGPEEVMPPKLRRPAAAPKAVAKNRGRRLRRPAAPEEEEDLREPIIEAANVTLEQCKSLDEIEVIKGSYWEAEVQAALKVKEVTIKKGELYLKSQVLGTLSESLLRAASTRPERMVEAHLCPLSCTGGPHSEGVFHVVSFRRLGQRREPWMSNMIPEEKRPDQDLRGPDELEEIRADMKRLQLPPAGGVPEEGGADPPPSEDKDKKEKKRKRSRSQKKKGKDFKVEGQKEVRALFRHTGVDPDQAVRRRFRRRAAKVARSKRKDSSGSSSSSSTSTCEAGGGDPSLFGASSKVQVIARRLPGALAAAALEEVSESLITAEGGLWETRDGPLPALFVRYYRHQLGGRMPAPMARETLTLCYCLDLLLRGRAAETLDVISQRVKALELQSTGIHFTVAQQQEILPREVSSISTTPELYEAARRAREEGKVRSEASRPYGARGTGAPRGEEPNKGWNKKGSGKGKGQKGDARQDRQRQSREGKAERELRGAPDQMCEAEMTEAGVAQEDTPPWLAPEEADVTRETCRERQPCDDLTRCPPGETPRGKVFIARPLIESDQVCLAVKGEGEFELPATAEGQQAEVKSGQIFEDGQTTLASAAVHNDLPAKIGFTGNSGTDGSSEAPLEFGGKLFSELGGALCDTLQHLSWYRHSKVMTMAEDQLFPLPLGEIEGLHPSRAPWMRAICQALNSLYGCSGTRTLHPTEVQKKLIGSLSSFLERMWHLEERVPNTPFGKLFDVIGVDYRGEEIKLARSFNWECIAGALPKEVGTLELSDFCTGGCRHYVENFEQYLLPPENQVISRAPRVLVAQEDWFDVCKGLIDAGICKVMPQDQLHHVGDQVLLNGLFAVSKNEFTETGLELHRLIMNLVPVNKLCRSLKGDVGTLPTLAGLSAFYLEDTEVAMMCSEDIKCFYYLFRIPESWHRFMGFARPVPPSLVPHEMRGVPCHLTALVLPMGFLNSVGIAQHVHRNVVRWSHNDLDKDHKGHELRRDRPAPVSRELYRVYLDNWDLIKKVDKLLVDEVEGRPSAAQLALRQQYLDLDIPRHPKKSVDSQTVAEIQGALLNGREGVAHAKPEKLLKYLGLGWELVQRGQASIRELQVVAGGFVYLTMFRRALLCSLNEVWVQIERLKGYPPVVRLPLPREVKLELVRFMALIPLAQMDFRLPMMQQVTASDASSTGGGISCSVGLTDFGVLAQKALVRGEFPEVQETTEVLTVGLFGGIGALRVAADVLQLPMAGHISVECNPYANRVLESAFPGSWQVASVEDVTEEEVTRWACEYSSVGVVLVGAGPPCQGVSQLNVDRKGSQKDVRSVLYKEIPRIVRLIRQKFPWAQVHTFVESVASMDAKDRAAMSQDLELYPNKVDSVGGVAGPTSSPVLVNLGTAGRRWHDPPGRSWEWLAQATGSRAAGSGLHTCDPGSLTKWRDDLHRYPPYQYKPEYGVHHSSGEYRVASILEREVILGFPGHYTEQCVQKADRKAEWVSDVRKTLLGNSWSVPVVACLLKPLFERLGLIPKLSIQEVINRIAPGVLQRPPVHRETTAVHPDDGLTRRLSGLVSIKGEDLLLQASSEQTVKYHRLRSSIPSKLWKWKEVAGWAWKGSGDHINQLEMRAVLTSVKYWVLKQKVHLLTALSFCTL
eukprot:s1737_g4.t1